MRAGGIFGVGALGEPMEPVNQDAPAVATMQETGWASSLFDAGLAILNEKRSEVESVGPQFDIPAGACTDPAVVAAVQAYLGVGADGKWGPKSQAALDKLGKTYKTIAQNCSGNVPKSGGTSGGTLPTTGGGGGVIVPPKPPTSLAGMTSSPVFWAILLAAGVGGYFYLTSPSPKQGKDKKGSRR